MVETLDTGLVNDNDKGGNVGTGTVEETLIVVRDHETDDEKGSDVDDGDTPKGVLDGRRHRLPWVGSLGGSKTNELGTGERKGSGDKDGADTLETVTGESVVRLLPVTSANVFTVVAAGGASTAVANDTDEDEHDDDEELEA